MDTQENYKTRIQQEYVRREARLRLAHQQSSEARPPLPKRFFRAIGDMLCRVGSRLKNQSYTKLSSEEPNPPNFLIML